MKILKVPFAILALLLICSISLMSCKDDKDEPENPQEVPHLQVNPSSISLVSMANSSATLTITCNSTWSITSKPEWINVSSTSGNGDTMLTITALTDNNTASVRSGSINIQSGSLSSTVEVSQVAGLESGCEVMISDEVILNTSATFRLKFGSKASFLYAGYFPVSSAGWSDDKLVSEMENNSTAMNAKDGLELTADELDEATDYIQCFVAYTENGKRGEVIRKKFTTPSSKNAPKAIITDMGYDSDFWYWSTKIGATAQEYYMLIYTGEIAWNYLLYLAPSDIGMIFKDKIQDLTSYVNSQDWYCSRDSGEEDLLICTWAQRDKIWSSVLNMSYKYASEDNSNAKPVKSIKKKSSAKGVCTPHYPEQTSEFSKHFRIVKKK